MKIKENTAKIALISSAVVLSVYHLLYALVTRHYDMPKGLLYLDYLLVLLFSGAFALYLAERFLRHGSVGDVWRSFDSGVVNRYTLGLLIFFAVCVICSIATEKTNPGSLSLNRGCLLDCAVSFFVMFPLGYWFAIQGKDRFLRCVIDTMTLLYVVFVAVAFLQLYSPMDIQLLSGIYIWDGRLYLATHPNVTGMECAMLMMAGVYRLLNGSKSTKVFYALSEALLFVALVLTDSRGSILAAILCFGILLVLIAWKWFAQTKSAWKIVLISAAAIILCAGMILVFRNIGKIIGNTGFQPRKMFGDQLGAGNGRLDMWVTIVRDILPGDMSIFLHGCGPYKIMAVLAELAGTVDKLGYEINTHNQFLEIAMGYGVPALIVFLAWLLLVAKCAMRTGLAKFQNVPIQDRILPLVLLFLIVSNQFETKLLFYRYAAGSFFFIVAGHVCGHFQRMKKQGTIQ